MSDQAFYKLMAHGVDFFEVCFILESCASVAMESDKTTDELVDLYIDLVLHKDKE